MNKSKLFDTPLIGKRFLKKYIIESEGGEMKSQSLRSYVFEKYHVDVGLFSYGGVFSSDFNVGGGGVEVGRYCSFASGITYYGANHPIKSATTSPYFYNQVFGLDVNDVHRSRLVH